MRRSCVHAVLPRAGLGNKLLVWARALVFAHLNGLPLYVSNWAEMKIGPFLRNEKSKRQYWGFFVKTNKPSLFRQLRFATSSCVNDPQLNQVAGTEKKFLYVFRKMPAWPDYFNELHEFRPLIIERFYQTVSPKYLTLARLHDAPVIGVHVRLSDFAKPLPGEVIGDKCNQRVLLDYYVQAVKSIREIHGSELPVTVFTDGRENEIADLLSLPYVKIAMKNPDIVDLLLLSRSLYLVVSPGSTFSYWAAFISDAHVITHSSLAKKIRASGDGLFEGPVENIPGLLFGAQVCRDRENIH